MALAHERPTLGLEPRFATPGVHPYDEVEWEHRHARIDNWADGTVAFEQDDVEFPASWSMTATNIVSQKYFRGNLGTPARESSLRQVIGRVVTTIADWGLADDYFGSSEEADVFAVDLTWLLLHQYAAFNSPETREDAPARESIEVRTFVIIE